MVAEKFHALIGAGAIAHALERGDVGERAIAQRDVLEAIANTLLERGAAAAARLFAAVRLAGFGRGDGSRVFALPRPLI
jgi:hypothetical protein